jgi:hypothetical protein
VDQPHSWIFVEVKDADGNVTPWAIEFGAPYSLMQKGLRRTDFPIGVEVTVKGFRAKSGKAVANASSVHAARRPRLLHRPRRTARARSRRGRDEPRVVSRRVRSRWLRRPVAAQDDGRRFRARATASRTSPASGRRSGARLRPRAARHAEGRAAGLGIVDGGAIPYQPAALERAQEELRGARHADPRSKCFTLGTPRGIYGASRSRSSSARAT